MCDKLIKLITNNTQQQRLLQSFTAVSLFSYSLTSVGAEPINIHDIKNFRLLTQASNGQQSVGGYSE